MHFYEFVAIFFYLQENYTFRGAKSGVIGTCHLLMELLDIGLTLAKSFHIWQISSTHHFKLSKSRLFENICEIS